METEHSNLIEDNTEDEFLTNNMDDLYKYSVILTNLVKLTIDKGSVVIDHIYNIIDQKKRDNEKKNLIKK